MPWHPGIHIPPRPLRRARLALVVLWLSLPACVVVYQPMSGLHRPIALEAEYAYLTGLKIDVHCVPGQVLEKSEAIELCRKLTRMFESRGATVETSTRRGRIPQYREEGEARAQTGQGQLRMELNSRILHKEESFMLFWTSVTDYTFAQDVEIRDENGFLLVRDTLIGRFVRRVGFTSDAQEEFSKDFYGMINQLALNARMRRQVLVEGR